MKNAYFNHHDLTRMLSGGSLKLISSVKSDVNAIKPAKRYLDWINKNCDNHDYREAMLVLSGSGTFSLNGAVYPSLPGTFFFMDSKEKHDSYYPPFYDNFRHLWFRIVNKTIFTGDPYAKTNGIVKNTRSFNYTFNENNHAGQLFINAWDRLKINHAIGSEFDWLYFEQLCRAGNDILLKKNEAPIELHHKTAINAVAEHIRETGGRNLNTAKLAYIAGYSKFHFARLFKKITGCSVLAFINLSRINKCREFSQKGLSKKQISDELGFSSPAAFSRWSKDNLKR
jgi:AraC-like DNA-binding protein